MNWKKWPRWWPKTLRFKIPSTEEIKKNRYLRPFGGLLNAGYLWHFHRHNVTKAIAIGVFCANLPMPFQMIPATAIAILWRAHLPISIACVWLSNPLTMPFLIFAQYHLGAFILRKPDILSNFDVSFEWVASQFHQIWAPLLLGAFITACVSSLIAYFITKYCWRRWILRRYERRHAK